MGASVILMLEKGEAKKIKDKLKESYLAPKIKIMKWQVGCWVKLKGSRIVVEYQSGWGNDEWGLAIAKVIASKVKVKKAGWDTIGYCKDIKEFMDARPFDMELNNCERYNFSKKEKDGYLAAQKAFEEAAEKYFE